MALVLQIYTGLWYPKYLFPKIRPYHHWVPNIWSLKSTVLFILQSGRGWQIVNVLQVTFCTGAVE